MSELEQLRRWKAEAMPLFDGLQDLGRALDIPLGVLVTGPVAVEAANRLRERAEAAEAAVERVRALARWWASGPTANRDTMTREVAALGLREALEGREGYVEAPGSADRGAGGVDGRSEAREGRSGGMG